MKQRSKAALRRQLHPADGALPHTERAELHRQGAKAAARGEAARDNPMHESANLPDTTGECETVWAERRDAWQSGHDVQSQTDAAPAFDPGPEAMNGRRAPGRAAASGRTAPTAGLDGAATVPTTEARTGSGSDSTVDAAADPTNPTNPAAVLAITAAAEARLLTLHREIVEAQDTLAALHVAITHARGEEHLQAMQAATQENQRLHAELRDQGLRAAREADSAFAALQDAVRVSETDPLTQLPNRLVLWDRLAHDLARAKRQAAPLAVLFMDLDGFKAINDRLGHDVGDLLLRHVARTLTETMRASDTVCRLGGDEFVIVANDIPRAELPGLCRKVSDALAEPCVLAGHVISPSLSIGTSSYPDDGETPEALVRAADVAMYSSKRQRLATPDS